MISSLTHSCFVLWYPEENHVDFCFKDKVYDCFLRAVYRPKKTSMSQKALGAENNISSPHYQIKLGLTESEYQKIDRVLERCHVPNTCCGGIASILNKGTSMSIPFTSQLSPIVLVDFLSKSPRFLSVAYFASTRLETDFKFDVLRVKKMERQMVCFFMLLFGFVGLMFGYQVIRLSNPK